MHIVITGATGFLGSALAERLLHAGHQLSAISHAPAQARSALNPAIRVVANAAELAQGRVNEPLDAVIDLAGASLADRRWSEAYKTEIRQSRIARTEALTQDLERHGLKPRIWLGGSAIGYYGDGGERALTESASNGQDFGAALCRDWEAAGATAAGQFGARGCWLRTGIVLGPGGALAKMLPPFRLGLGGPIGDGRHYMAWIHRDDWVALVLHLLADDRLSGPFNLTAPHPVPNAEFAEALGRALHRPARLPMPAVMLKLLLGEFADVVLSSQNVLPAAALNSGFVFRYPQLPEALTALVG